MSRCATRKTKCARLIIAMGLFGFIELFSTRCETQLSTLISTSRISSFVTNPIETAAAVYFIDVLIYAQFTEDDCLKWTAPYRIITKSRYFYCAIFLLLYTKKNHHVTCDCVRALVCLPAQMHQWENIHKKSDDPHAKRIILYDYYYWHDASHNKRGCLSLVYVWSMLNKRIKCVFFWLQKSSECLFFASGNKNRIFDSYFATSSVSNDCGVCMSLVANFNGWQRLMWIH